MNWFSAPQVARRLSRCMLPLAFATIVIADEVEFTDAISREFSVFNDLSGEVAFDDAISREFSLFNDLAGEIAFDDAIGREFSLFNDLVGDVEMTDGIGREFSVFNDLVGSDVIFVDAISREFSVQTGTLSVTISSSGGAYAYAVGGTLPEQIDRLNQSPPTFDHRTWNVVSRQVDRHKRDTFRCDLVGIEDVSGTVELIDPPDSCEVDTLESSTRIRAFNELVDVKLTKDLKVTLTEPGTYDDSGDLPAGGRIIKVGTRVNAHLVHFDTLQADDHALDGSITVDSEIIGVILLSSQLNSSDVILGLPETAYPTGDMRRSVELDSADSVTLSNDRRTISFSLQNSAACDQIRVVTAVPNNLSYSYVDADSYLDDADEVTLDNCQSAFYRFTFLLPPDFTVATLAGVANADDEAVVYLNGTRISALLKNPGCDPDPTDPDDPCFDKQDAGTDRKDGDGKPVLTWPTQDEFGTADAKLFKTGENELVFAVCGGAAAWKPTGVEFVATVTIDASVLLGDLNCDGSVTFEDIDPFVLVLIDKDQYSDQFPNCSFSAADTNQDGSVDFLDIDPFVECLVNEGCPNK